ncbi:MAG: PEP-CTERM sorting domain-containing protein [Isosphaerales bacterium]
MRIGRFKLWSAVAALGLLAGLACENRAHADVLVLGGDFTSFNYTFEGTDYKPGGAGSIDPSTLNGISLPWVYCTDIKDDIPVPATYNNTTVTFNGVQTTTENGTAVTTNAGQVAWMLGQYANAAIGDDVKQEALQAAIWKAIYGNKFSVDASNSATLISDYNAIVAAAAGQSASLSSVSWLSPAVAGSSTIYQSLVTSVVPEPSSLSIAGLSILGFLGYGWRRRKAQGA